jgi:transposase-like protein
MRNYECAHDYENPIRKGRAHYECQKCGADITIALVLIADCEEE